MKNTDRLPTWVPRIKPYLIRRLYESDAQGLLDADLLEEVGWGLFSRCQSFLQADEARRGTVRCPVCQTVVLMGSPAKQRMHCPTCGWACAYRSYLDTIKNQQLNGGPEVIALFQDYTNAFPQASEPHEKMLVIDGLLHGFHHFLTSGRTRRPVGINLIDGHIEFVVDFLDHLTYGPGSTPGTRAAYETWHEKIHAGGKK